MNFSILGKCVLIAGKRGSGKTVLAKDIISKEKHKFSHIFLFSPTERINNDYKDLVEPKCVFDKLSEAWIEKLFQKQSSIPKDQMKNILIICDDIGSETDLSQNRKFVQIYTRGRHLKISILFLAQYIYQLPKICRANLDYIAVSQQNAQSIQILSDEFNSHLPNQEFKNLYQKVTTNYGFLLINSNNIKDTKNLNELYGVLRAEL